jgi:hypothetical protein
MKFQTFVDDVVKKHHEFRYDRAILWGSNVPITDMTLGMPFKEYHELLLECLNQPNFYVNPANGSDIIKHFMVNGIKVHLVEDTEVRWWVGMPQTHQKFFKDFDFQPSTPQAKVIQMQTLPHRA